MAVVVETRAPSQPPLADTATAFAGATLTRSVAADPRLAIQVEGLRKSFGPRPVLEGVNLALDWGQRLALLGPNGSGKTTLLRILATLQRPDSGCAFVGGRDVVGEAGEVRPLLGVLSHQTYLYRDLTAAENLKFYAQMYRVPRIEERVAELLQRVGLAAHADALARTLSRGMAQRLALARVLLHRPSVILLDEPDTGLDLDSAAVLRELLSELAEEGCGVLLTTHQFERASTLADEVAVLARGRIVFRGDAGRLDAEGITEIYRRHAAR
jgi:heme ABC exporter ATP-binding subunit CcmA